ncbi:LINE-1 type transposase domain-containing protein 1 [Elysia marginata]|uniref:LINE-1 type transposase domain-containing protein 1 n=1 Tax=Elysia marginata TaxID=1093978 RepID=A0AAV4IH15_9GAST|nr:LINE-1 type transposase domain-containing protein 1 [Elysia marginata]
MTQSSVSEESECFENEIVNRIKTLEVAIKNNANENTRKLFEEIEKLQGAFHDVLKEQSELKKEVNQLREERSVLVDEVQQLRDLTWVLKNQQNELEQYTRKNNIRVFGLRDKVKFEEVEDTTSLVLDLFRGRLGLTHFDPQTIDVAHRIGPFKKEYDRAVIVRFTTHRAANEVLAKRRALKGSGITIAEDLTPTNAAKFRKFREIKCVQRAWTKRGEIYVKREDGLILKVGPRDTVEDITKRLLTQTRSTHQKQNKHSAILQHAQPDKPKTQTLVVQVQGKIERRAYLPPTSPIIAQPPTHQSQQPPLCAR